MPGPRCARPGCGADLAAWLTYDYGGRTVWLDPPEAEPGGTGLGLCPGHADRLRVPLGWTCRDRRGPAVGRGVSGEEPSRPSAGV